jgi:hypothetical protein
MAPAQEYEEGADGDDDGEAYAEEEGEVSSRGCTLCWAAQPEGCGVLCCVRCGTVTGTLLHGTHSRTGAAGRSPGGAWCWGGARMA